MNWPKDKPLDLLPPGWLLSAATPEQYDAVQEDKKRWFAAVEMHNQISQRKVTKSAVWAQLQSEPEVYAADMARRLKALGKRGKK